MIPNKQEQPIDVVKSLLDGEISFPDDEKNKQQELERLKILMSEAKTEDEKKQIEFAIRQLVLS